MYLEQYSTFWDIVLKGSWLQNFVWELHSLTAMEMAKFGIGDDYHRPKVRLPGTAGLGDMGSIGNAFSSGIRTTTPDPSLRKSTLCHVPDGLAVVRA
ncbi:hypothetical protein CM1200mP19_2440 [bacterium]|nr:MAG: hypothetical protein CM1200mP19_2440 [bacterium]